MQGERYQGEPRGSRIGSSSCGGWWDGEHILPAGWVDHGRALTIPSFDQYGAHWWLALHDPGIFTANGFNGQYIVVVPDRDLVLVRLGVSNPDQRGNVIRGLREVVESFPQRDGGR